MTAEPRIDVRVVQPETRQGLTPEQLREVSGSLPRGPWFGMRLEESGEGAPQPWAQWKLRGRLYDRQGATGTAVVHLSPRHRTLTRPFIFADGFSYGPSDLPGLWQHFNRPYAEGVPGFLDQLRAMGMDVILLGFDVRHTHIQANAGVAIACIQRAIAEMPDSEQLTVGGVSMGGMVTRYALAELEYQQMNHRTGTYLSWDTPHNGAWTPLILQQLAYFFEAFTPPDEGEASQAELLRSPAAQQLLWGWVPTDTASGPVGPSPLRQRLMDELEQMKGFPQRPLRLGVANGAGNGTGRPLPPGEVALAFDLPGLAGAEARFQPDRGERQPVGHMRLLGNERHSDTSAVPAFDGAPGGTLETFGAIAGKLGIPIEEAYRFSCFVPSVSAVALEGTELGWPDHLYADLSVPSSQQYGLHDFCCDAQNTEHSSLSRPLVEWIVSHLAK